MVVLTGNDDMIVSSIEERKFPLRVRVGGKIYLMTLTKSGGIVVTIIKK